MPGIVWMEAGWVPSPGLDWNWSSDSFHTEWNVNWTRGEVDAYRGRKWSLVGARRSVKEFRAMWGAGYGLLVAGGESTKAGWNVR